MPPAPTRGWPPSSRTARRAAPPRPNWPCARRKACPPGLMVIHPITGEPIDVWVGNYVLMGYGDGAVMGVPAHDERDFAFRAQVQPDDHAGGARGRRALRLQALAGLVRRQGTAASPSTPTSSAASPTRTRSRRWRTRWSKRAWARRRPPGACATGASAASATGARRSRSSIARSTARCRCPRRTCRWCCRRTACPMAPATR